MTTPTKLKFRDGRYNVPVDAVYSGKFIFLKFPFNRNIMDQVKQMRGAHWCGYDTPPLKAWRVDACDRNDWWIRFLSGENVYAKYDAFEKSRDVLTDSYTAKIAKLYNHQKLLVQQALTTHGCLWAAEMGLGKSLAFLEVLASIPNLTDGQAWYIGPRSGVTAVNRELIKWNPPVKPRMFTYNGLLSELTNWDGSNAPKVVCFDESSKIKTPTAQRSQAAMFLAEAIRKEWGDAGYVILMTGTPSPKTPVDWWHQCEVACPGFLREGDINKLRRNLSIIEQRESLAGGVYPHLISWMDDEKKCKKCGQYEDAAIHKIVDSSGDPNPACHPFVQSVNEVHRLYSRMSGLVTVLFKKDCVDLPEIQYETIRLKPAPDMVRAMHMIRRMSRRTIEALTMMRELSDGFQYTDVRTGEKECENCGGSGQVQQAMPETPIDTQAPIEIPQMHLETVSCPVCGGSGRVNVYDRQATVVGSPKDEVFKDFLDEYEDIGRFIVWGGFTGTIDRLVEMACSEGWAVLRVDGRGYCGFAADGTALDSAELLSALDASDPRRVELMEKYPKLCFVGNPGSGGMALTLTMSPVMLYYSNDFNGESRMQSEARFHRVGMDTNRGALIYDILLLPTDELVLNNLKKKRELQALTLNDLDTAMKFSDAPNR